ncbi:Dual specificity tyrosine-phosphorylation-regulated kinase 3 [Tritrichomonas foetus]|uniref:dual-specificity kinase n=1 Tax=Tritrichomonas foetus TaxID=1144522 RepID=A0A1J4J939_9EUKA|nr:Dual specificity tyrosine-phosphorylation-regulated kinase 3 [Tritrichomonas foetus]|eukprot:OHS95201.1 Dual specificity tyrosine-phosphorylation-regulated kinase 3 [Tritrichomonas foetus]
MIGANVAPPIPIHPPVMKSDNPRRPRIFAPKIKVENNIQKSDNSLAKSSENLIPPIVPPGTRDSSRPHPPEISANIKNPRNRIPNTARPIRLTGKIPNGPIPPKEAVARYPTILTAYEITEILNYPDVYFIGNVNRKIKTNLSDPFNAGFDDKFNNYKLVPGDHLGYRFEIISILGSGAFGQVVKCIDHKTNQIVAVKVIQNTQLMNEQGKIEVQILYKLSQARASHIVRALDYFVFRNHICITFEVLGPSLYNILKNHNFEGLQKKNIRIISQNIFKGLDQCHKLGIIHCDIKPENILQSMNNGFKLIDFGSSCFLGNQRFQYIQSRFYRAPEVILGIGYGPPMDIWSAALVVIEMAIGKPLFAGHDEAEVISMMMELLGKPPFNVLQAARRRRDFFDDYGRFRTNITRIKRKEGSLDLRTVLNDSDPLFYDFLIRCLTWDPTKRMTASEALRHPWITHGEAVLPDLH